MTIAGECAWAEPVRLPRPAATLFDTWPLILGSTLLRQPRPAQAILDIPRSLLATVEWVESARRHSPDGGVPACFDLLRGRWRPAYPETTGYLVPTLYACADRLREPGLGQLGTALADDLLRMRTPEGGVAHWDRAGQTPGVPVVFDTGQVIFGWLAAWRRSGRTAYRRAACEAAEWLVGVQAGCGAWLRYQHLGTVKVIDARVAWALIELGRALGQPAFVEAGRRNLEWVLAQQQPNGWFHNAAFQPGLDPFTHTIAYTAEGLLESGLVLPEPRFVVAARLAADALLARQRPKGDLASTYASDWAPTERSSCLTGNCQMALLWLRLHALTGEARYLGAARRAVAFVAGTQGLSGAHAGVRGGVAGSYPVYGPYERLKYPSWAAKFFLDALLALEAAEAGRALPERIG